MQIVSPRDIRLRDLPHIESPALAVAQADRLLADPYSPAWLVAQDLGPYPGATMRTPENRQRIVGRVAAGELFVVHSPLHGEQPLAPLVDWREPPGQELGGAWRNNDPLKASSLNPILARINARGLTPAQINDLTQGGLGHSNADHIDSTLFERQHRQQLQAEDARRAAQPLSQTLPTLAGATVVSTAESAKHESLQKKRVRVEAGVFFDGTGNNMANAMEHRRMIDQCLSAHAAGKMDEATCSAEISQHLEGSYLNDITNVVKLYGRYPTRIQNNTELVTHTFRAYTSGVGTQDGEADSKIGLGSGSGSLGILSKVAQASGYVARQVARLAEECIDELVLDIFGFSRGAATARHFVNEVRAGENGSLGQAMQEEGQHWPKKVSVRFLGLFDTVAAVVDITHLDFSAHNSANAPVDVHVAPESAARVVHLTSRDERRFNFSLNSLRHKDGTLPDHFDEWSLPGVHSDIGGGYQSLYHDKVMPCLAEWVQVDRPVFDPFQTYQYQVLREKMAKVADEPWLGPLSEGKGLWIEPTQVQRHEHDEVRLRLWLDRWVRGGYSRIPLAIMHRLAVEAGVPLNELDSGNADYRIPEELQSVHVALTEHIFEGAPLTLSNEQQALLYQRYIHHSSDFYPVGVLHPMAPTASGNRAVYANGDLT